VVVQEGGSEQAPGGIGLAGKGSVAGEVVEDDAAVGRRQVAAGQDLLECHGAPDRRRAAGRRPAAFRRAGAVVGSVCADADHDALALAQRGGRACTDGGDQGFDAGAQDYAACVSLPTSPTGAGESHRRNASTDSASATSARGRLARRRVMKLDDRDRPLVCHYS